MKKITWFYVSVLIAFLAASCAKHDSVPYEPVESPAIRIGALLPLTGSGASSGESMAVALELAGTDIQQYFTAAGIDEKLVVEVADTRTDTAEALKQLKVFYQEGIRLVIGPYSSAELDHIRGFAGSHDMLILSPSSVAVSLAIPDDNIFRFVTSDIIQGKAMSKMLLEDKIKVIVPIVRNDVWGNDLAESTGAAFIKFGGMVQPDIKFYHSTTNFSMALNELDAEVAAELEHHNPNDVAIYLVSFSEGTRILAEAKKYSHLNNVYWYGASALSQNESMLNDTSASLFAYTHGLPCPVFGLDETAKYKWQPLQDRVSAIIGRIPDTYTYTAYDALWVLMQTYRSVNGKPDIEPLKTAFVAAADSYFGASGNTQLDANGDREFGNYDFWAVKSETGNYQWKRVARYNSQFGTLTRIVD
jgi:branched-chain amino acid transport system substrate-binding protein